MYSESFLIEYLVNCSLSGKVEADDEEEEEEDLCAQDLIDFSPVYRCLHIFSVLGSRDTFETYYRQQRKQQARLVLQPSTNMVSHIQNYFMC